LAGERTPILFLFFSNRLGCAGSLLVTALGTLLILWLLGLLRM
jgi:hypothetical protein